LVHLSKGSIIMKFLLPLAAVCMLAGCASQQPRPANYGTRAPEMANVAVPAVGSVTEDGWRVVSVTPTNPAPANLYAPAPVVVEPEYYVPPVSFSLGLMLGRGVYLGGHRHPRWRHHGRRR
jgi:hypothetical protein